MFGQDPVCLQTICLGHDRDSLITRVTKMTPKSVQILLQATWYDVHLSNSSLLISTSVSDLYYESRRNVSYGYHLWIKMLFAGKSSKIVILRDSIAERPLRNNSKEVEYTDNIIYRYTTCSRKYNIAIAYRVNNKRSFFSFSLIWPLIRRTL